MKNTNGVSNMDIKIYLLRFVLLLSLAWMLGGCAASTDESPPTGGSAVGAGVGAVLAGGTAALLDAPKPIIGLAAVGGAGLGYYLTSLRFASKGIIRSGGKVYTLGEYMMIEIPTDNLFEPNTDEFLPGTEPVLDSIVDILKRYPNHNIFISGNTSGFGTHRFEQKLSEDRAAQIAAYLWAHGVTDGGAQIKSDRPERDSNRRLIYVGYGDALPIANNLHLESIRANSRIQIVASPCGAEVKCKKCFRPFDNVGRWDDEITSTTEQHPTSYAAAFPDDHLPEESEMTPQPHTRDFQPMP
jgi:hypothetical protein